MADAGRGHAYFPYIDGLRAMAVLSVVLYHLDNAWLPGGFSGVDVFFVISGFVVSASVASRLPASLPAFAGYFLARRLQRIAPALVACLLVTALVDAVLVPDAWLSHRNQVTGRFAFFGFSNVVMARADNDYFSPIAELNPYTHTWSLGVEEQFYLVFPVLFFLWMRGGRWRASVTAITALAVAASAAYAGWLGSRDATQAFYVLGTRFWEIGAGVLLYQYLALRGIRPPPVPRRRRAWTSVGAMASLLVIATGLLVSRPEAFPVPGAWMAVLGTVGVLGFLQREDEAGVVYRVLSARPMVVIGRISYSLYLWHWPVFVLFRWTVGLETAAARIIAVALAFVLAGLSYRFIETPVRQSTRLRGWPRGAVVAVGLCLVCGGLWTMKQITHHQRRISVSTVTRHEGDWYPDDTRVVKATRGLECAVTSEVTQVGKGFRQAFTRAACGRELSGPTVHVIGDSHAVAFAEMFSGYTRDTGAPVFLYNNEGCPFLSLQEWRDDTVPCAASSRRVVADVLGRVKAGDVVFLPSLRMPRYVDQWAAMRDGSVDAAIHGRGRAQALAANVVSAEGVVARLTEAGARVVITAPNLLLRVPLYRCADIYDRANPICAAGSDVDRAAFETLRAPMLAAVNSVARASPGTAVWDLFPLLCPPGATCHAYREGRPLFFDGDHLSGYANRLLLPSFEKAMGATGAGG